MPVMLMTILIYLINWRTSKESELTLEGVDRKFYSQLLVAVYASGEL